MCSTYRFSPPVVAANGMPRKTELLELSRKPLMVPCGMTAVGMAGRTVHGEASAGETNDATRTRLVAFVKRLASPMAAES